MPINFNLKIHCNPDNFVIFSLPTSNSYQEITSLSYVKDNCLLITDRTYSNKILVIKDIMTEEIKFKAILKSRKIDLNNIRSSFNDQQKKLVKENKYVNGKDAKIREIANPIRNNNITQVIKDSYEFVIAYLNYGNPQEGLYTYKQALEEKVTDCGGFSTLLAAILNANAIPTRLVIGFLLKKDLLTKIFYTGRFNLTFKNLLMHAWVEALLPDSTWFPMDPSIDWKRRKGLTSREGGFGYIPNDRLITSFGEDFKLNVDGKNYEIPILQNPLRLKLLKK